jgi:hypothetical protein
MAAQGFGSYAKDDGYLILRGAEGAHAVDLETVFFGWFVGAAATLGCSY